MPDNNIFGVDFIARCLAGEGLETANKRQWKLQAGPRIILSDNPATQTTTISATGDDITVDDELSLVSENPVQNKVITDALRYKPDTVISNGTKVANQKIMQLTRAQYNAIRNKDPNTYYMITDDVDTIVLRTAYKSVVDDYTSTMTANGDWVLTFELEDTDFEKLDVYLQFQFDWVAGADWAGPNTTKRSIMLSLTKDVTEPVYSNTMNIYLANTSNSASNPHYMGLYDLLIGSISLTYDETTHIVTMQVNKPLMDAVNDPDHIKNNYPVSISNCIAHAFGYVAYGSDNVNITHDSYTAGAGISINNNNEISIDANYGSAIELDVNSSTYVVTATLRDQNNNVLSTDTIDLPLESVVVSGSYDAQTEKIILTLQNGNTIEFSVASLVSGLEETSNKVTTITSQSTNTEYPSAAAVYSLVNGQSYDEVPAVTSSDDGKILTADYTGGVGSYSWEDAPNGLPASTSVDEGKVLTVDSSGDPGWSALPSVDEVPAVTSNDDAKFLMASYVGGTGSYLWEYPPEEIPEVTSSDDGKVLTASYNDGVGIYSWETPSGPSVNEVPAVTSADNDKTLVATYSGGAGSYAWQSVNYVPNAAAGDQGKVLTTDALGNPVWRNIPSVDEVPDVTSSDDGKILTASYSGGIGSYAWTSPQTFSQQQADWTETDSSAVDYIKNKPNLATVATSGSYNDLSNKPTIPAAQIPADWNQTDNQAADYIKNKPTIPAAQVNSDWNAASGVSQILNKPDLSVYLTSSDLSGYATENYVDGKVPDTTQYDEGKYLTVGSNGNEWALIDEVPDIGSSDDGKVLTASYSGGVGSYSWQPASGGGGGGLSVETDGTNYWITVNGIRLYFASSAPTGTIPDGSLGIGW